MKDQQHEIVMAIDFETTFGWTVVEADDGHTVVLEATLCHQHFNTATIKIDINETGRIRAATIFAKNRIIEKTNLAPGVHGQNTS